MNYKLNIAIKNNNKRIFFFSLNLFDKSLYNSFYFERVQKNKLFFFDSLFTIIIIC